MRTSAFPVSVGMATREAGELTYRALESVIPQLERDDELVVVFTGRDGAKVDPLADWLGRHCPAARLLMRLRAGASGARNAVLEAVRYPIVCFLDDDETAEPGWLAAHRRGWVEAPADLAVIGGPTHAEWDGGRPPWLRDHLLYVVSFRDLGDERLVLDGRPGKGFAWAGNMSVRTSAVMAVGAFDPLLGPRPGVPFARGEEEELQHRLVEAGWQVWYEPTARIRHHIRRERLSLDYVRNIRAWNARSEATEPHALRHGLIRLARSAARYTYGLLRRDQVERQVALLGISYALTLVRAALVARS